MQHLAQRARFGFEPSGAALGFGQRLALDIERLTRGGMRRLGAQGCGLALGDRFLRDFDRLQERVKIGAAFVGGIDPRKLGNHIGDVAFEPRQALGLLAGGALQRIAARGQIGQRAGRLAEILLRFGELRIGFRHAARRH